MCQVVRRLIHPLGPGLKTIALRGRLRPEGEPFNSMNALTGLSRRKSELVEFVRVNQQVCRESVLAGTKTTRPLVWLRQF